MLRLLLTERSGMVLCAVRCTWVQPVTAATGCTQVHLSGHKALADPSVSGNPGIHFGGALYPPEDRFSLIDRDYISAVRGKLG